MARALIALLVLLTAQAMAATSAPKKPARRVPAPVPLVLPPAPGEQLAANAMIYFGDYACEFNQRLQVSLNPLVDGYVDVKFGQQVHTMKPVLSRTGALRLEDVRGRMLLVQIPVKSMLLDVQAGHRLVDECVHEKQAENRRALAAAPAQPGLGIEPGRDAGFPASAASSPDMGSTLPPPVPPASAAEPGLTLPPVPPASAAEPGLTLPPVPPASAAELGLTLPPVLPASAAEPGFTLPPVPPASAPDPGFTPPPLPPASAASAS